MKKKTGKGPRGKRKGYQRKQATGHLKRLRKHLFKSPK